MASLDGFIPCYGKKQDLSDLSKIDGQFIVLTDNKKIYLDYEGRRSLIAEARSPQDLYTGIFYMSDWEQDPETSIYSQIFEIEDITGELPLLIDLIVSDDPAIAEIEESNWAKITKVVAKEGQVIGYCYGDMPNCDLTFQMKEV